MANPCIPTLSVPQLPGLTLNLSASLTSLIATDKAALLGQINLLSLNIKSLSSLPSLSFSGLGLPLTLGPGKLSGIVSSVVGGLVKSVEAQVTDQLEAEALSIISSVVSGALGQITGAGIGDLQKSVGTVLNALSSINAVLGQVEADKLLASAVLGSLSCPAKAETLAEIYFKSG